MFLVFHTCHQTESAIDLSSWFIFNGLPTGTTTIFISLELSSPTHLQHQACLLLHHYSNGDLVFHGCISSLLCLCWPSLPYCIQPNIRYRCMALINQLYMYAYSILHSNINFNRALYCWSLYDTMQT